MNPLVLCTLTIIVTLAVSGYAKVKEPTSTVTAIVNLKLNRFLPVKLVARVLPWAELALAVALLVLPGTFQILAALASLAFFASYWAVIARALVQGNTASCNCFGGASTAPTSVFTLIRNTALFLASAGALIGALNTGGSAITQLLALDSAGWLWLIGAFLASLTLWSINRAESLKTPPSQQLEQAPPAAAAQAEDDYIRTPIPYSALYYPAEDPTSSRDGTGQQTSLRDLALAQARIIIWVSPGCGHCHKVVNKLAGWQEQIPMIALHPVVASGKDVSAFAMAPHIQVLIDPGFMTRKLFGQGTPGALALGMDGLLAGGPVTGGDNVITFVEDIITEVTQDYPNHVQDSSSTPDGTRQA
ncbi:MauE/DoxX family redox-associated membrane protein [Rothia sp. P4278]|uniref:MauE/DoxX family redox-associated membrane protein n=1 Tax=Rothia sp. P4278 TaxID=3402658 RepID=UPI003AE53C57